MDFPSKLKEAREAAGLTQVELSRALDVSYSAIQKWEGGSSVPGLDTFIRLSEFFEWPLPITSARGLYLAPGYAYAA